jgi:hypothetical protein
MMCLALLVPFLLVRATFIGRLSNKKNHDSSPVRRYRQLWWRVSAIIFSMEFAISTRARLVHSSSVWEPTSNVWQWSFWSVNDQKLLSAESSANWQAFEHCETGTREVLSKFWNPQDGQSPFSPFPQVPKCDLRKRGVWSTSALLNIMERRFPSASQVSDISHWRRNL